MLKGNYLRVLSPRTTNGTNPKIGPDGRIVYREDHLPLTAKRPLEAQNAKLPEHLRKIIEVVYDGVQPDSNAFGQLQPKVRNKPGPKPKNQTAWSVTPLYIVAVRVVAAADLNLAVDAADKISLWQKK